MAVTVAAVLVILALARPQALVSVTGTAGVDFVILLDGSTSMRVADVAPDRWRRSVAWVRAFAEVLGWRRERVALALFAHRAAPQVRLTNDPNALFFFLDHLAGEPPFRGVRVHAIGVGTAGGGFIPRLPPGRYQEPEPPIHSVLDRRSLRAVAQAGGGRYFELGSEPDHVVALRILSDAQRSARGGVERRESFTDLYWGLLAAAAAVLGAATLLIEERARLWWQLAVAGALGAALLP